MYGTCLKRKCREIVTSKLKEGCPGHSITDQIFTLKQIEKFWEFANDVFASFSRQALESAAGIYGIDERFLSMVDNFVALRFNLSTSIYYFSVLKDFISS